MGNWRIPFHDETTESKQRLQKYPRFILEKLDDIGSEEAIPNPIGQMKKFVNPVWKRP